ncbi:DUF2213 domain-containing protein [Cronobacter turicensis]|uniref:DUF2213 domain-containing protein n=1 Tax=Cronobacter turicensis TaxID=413502 RepID=UPI001D726641|nr:DUF2213 domain-containing protein [Cronobacter turicensis]EGT4490705.1 DUF2213 domain-containing protein [Cronobacter turicensis]MDI6417471.1 DUF2213 domain-containing protein [Cronobacter turicensis]MDI6463968.1 DUF2213 domain-containing protein [Cronobacter turicensis]MDI7673267.1 DUF2213 domain-containing protein [Cronobacter turicensis]
MKLSSIHVKSLAINSSNISTETIDGDEHIVIRGVVPVVDDVVMNGGLYPAEEINKSFKTLEGNPMPFGHPKIGNEHVSATNPRAVNQFHVGAWAENVRKDGDRVVMDMKVNKRIAQSSEKGKRLIERLDELQANSNAEPIHVSTGLLLRREQNSGKSKGKSYSWVARNMQFDHVAILLDEPGAATPKEGVGIFVNADNSQQEVEVTTVNLEEAEKESLEETITTKVINSLKALFSANSHVKEEADPMKDLITNALKAAGKEVEGKTDAELMDAYNQMMSEKTASKAETPEEKAAREKKEAEEKAAKDKATNSEEAPAWFKPFADKLSSIESGLTANADQEKATKREAVKAKFKLDDMAVNALDGAALDGLYAQCATTRSLSGAFNHSTDKPFSEMPE